MFLAAATGIALVVLALGTRHDSEHTFTRSLL
jgi:hypothetical protein